MFATVLLAVGSLVATLPVTPVSADDADTFEERYADATASDPDFGPADGVLMTDVSSLDFDTAAFAGVWSEDIAVSVEFEVPYDDDPWAVYVAIRAGLTPHYWFFLYSTGDWRLAFDGFGNEESIAAGEVEDINVAAGETNTIELVTDGEVGYVAVNGDFVDALEIPEVGTGAVSITALSRVEDTEVRYSDFSVWALDGSRDLWLTGDDAVDFDAGANVFAAAAEAVEGADPDFGPERGRLQVKSMAVVPSSIADVEVLNFVAHAEFEVPYGSEVGSWDAAIFFQVNEEPEYRFIVASDRHWYLSVGTGDAIETGPLPDLPLEPGDQFTLDIVVAGASAYVGVDGEFQSRIPLPVNEEPGRVAITTSVFGANTVLDTVLVYRDFSVWDLGDDFEAPDPDDEDAGENGGDGDDDDAQDQAAGDDGTIYASDEFGYSFTYDDTWTVTYRSVVLGSDRVEFQSDASSVAIVGVGTARTLDDCLDWTLDFARDKPAFTDLEVAVDDAGADMREVTADIATMTVEGNFTSENGDENAVVVFIQCRPIDPGASILIFSQTVFAENVDAERPGVERLIDSIVIPEPETDKLS